MEQKRPHPLTVRPLCHSIALTELNPPIFPSATFALHQAEADQLAAQGGGVVVIALQNLIDLFLTITFVRFKSFDDVAQDRFEFFSLCGERFEAPVLARVVADHFLVVGIRVHLGCDVRELALAEHGACLSPR